MKNWNCKTPIKINRENLLDIDLGNDDFEYDTNSTGNKSKNKQVELHRTIAKKLYQNEKTTYRMGKNICKSCI